MGKETDRKWEEGAGTRSVFQQGEERRKVWAERYRGHIAAGDQYFAFATDALERRGNLAALMKALGHADAQTAMKYQHPGLERIRMAVDERK